MSYISCGKNFKCLGILCIFLVKCPYLQVGDRTFFIAYTSENSKYIPYLLTDLLTHWLADCWLTYSPIFSNQLITKPVKERDCYRYWSVDENIEFVGPINKDRILKEYTNRVQKIWTSELSNYN